MADNDKKKVVDRQVVEVWTRLIEAAQRKKAKRFDKDREKILKFYAGPHDFIYDEAESAGWAKTDKWAQMTVNLTFELVEIFGPILYQANPVRTITSRTEDLVYQVFAKVLEKYINYTPHELSLKQDSRDAITDALISGMGVLWTTLDRDTGLVGSKHEPVENILLDPDAKRMKDIWWIARKRVEPAWFVERIFPETAKGIIPNRKSNFSMPTSKTHEKHMDKSTSQDMVLWYEIYSKMGVGMRSKDAPPELREMIGEYPEQDNVFIAIAPGHDQPLAVEDWPAPLFLDGKWFHSILSWHNHPEDVYPIAPMKPAMGEQVAIDYLATFMMAKAKNASRDVIGVDPSIDENAINQLISGRDLEVVSLTGAQGRSIHEVVSWLQHPGIPGDLKEMFRLMIDLFEKRSGMAEILYGTSGRGIERTARAVLIKDRNSRARIDDKADQVEHWMNEAARKEAMLARFLLEPGDIEKAVGKDKIYAFAIDILYEGARMTLDRRRKMFPSAGTYYETEEEVQMALQKVGPAVMLTLPGAQIEISPVTAATVWRDTSTLDDNIDIVREFTYRIEAGSARRPNREWVVEQAEMVLQQVGALSLQLPPGIDTSIYNECLDMLYDSYMVPSDRRVYLEPQMAPPPPMAPMPAAGGGGQAAPAAAPPAVAPQGAAPGGVPLSQGQLPG